MVPCSRQGMQPWPPPGLIGSHRGALAYGVCHCTWCWADLTGAMQLEKTHPAARYYLVGIYSVGVLACSFPGTRTTVVIHLHVTVRWPARGGGGDVHLQDCVVRCANSLPRRPGLCRADTVLINTRCVSACCPLVCVLTYLFCVLLNVIVQCARWAVWSLQNATQPHSPALGTLMGPMCNARSIKAASSNRSELQSLEYCLYSSCCPGSDDLVDLADAQLVVMVVWVTIPCTP